MLNNEYPVVSTGNLYTAVDTYDTTKQNNGALNPLGARYTYPMNTQLDATKGFAFGASYLGYGVPLSICYVQYFSTALAAFIAAPGVVYWTDKTFRYVTGLYSESAFGINGIAGYMLLNTTNYPGSLTGAQLASVVQPGGASSTVPGNFIWIVTRGYVPSAESAGSVAAGDYLIGSTSAFIPARMAANSSPTNRVVGMAATAVSSSLSDVVVGYAVDVPMV